MELHLLRWLLAASIKGGCSETGYGAEIQLGRVLCMCVHPSLDLPDEEKREEKEERSLFFVRVRWALQRYQVSLSSFYCLVSAPNLVGKCNYLPSFSRGAMSVVVLLKESEM